MESFFVLTFEKLGKWQALNENEIKIQLPILKACITFFSD